jgi:predicted house-cleaning noncanonical NTP pyrophosphatase (MazG superfamily)
MARQYYCKLVRDKIPDILAQKNIRCFVERVTDDSEKHKLLKQKLLEEVTEYISSNDQNELIDIFEVIAALAGDIHKFKALDFSDARYKKLEEKGGFTFGKVLIFTEEQEV